MPVARLLLTQHSMDKVESQYQHFKLAKAEYFNIRKTLAGDTQQAMNNDLSKVEGNVYSINMYKMWE